MGDNLEQAIALHKTGNISAAKKAYIEYLQSHPEDIRASYFYAILNTQIGDFPTAKTLLLKCQLSHPDDVDILYNLGVTYQHLSETNEAISSYKQLLVQSPRHYLALNNLGLLMLQADHLADAKALLERCIACKPVV